MGEDGSRTDPAPQGRRIVAWHRVEHCDGQCLWGDWVRRPGILLETRICQRCGARKHQGTGQPPQGPSAGEEPWR